MDITKEIIDSLNGVHIQAAEFAQSIRKAAAARGAIVLLEVNHPSDPAQSGLVAAFSGDHVHPASSTHMLASLLAKQIEEKGGKLFLQLPGGEPEPLSFNISAAGEYRGKSLDDMIRESGG